MSDFSKNPLNVIMQGKVKFQPDPKYRPGIYYSIRRLGWEDAKNTATQVCDTIISTQIMGEGLLDNFAGVEKQSVGQMLISFFLGFPAQLHRLYNLLAPLLSDENDQPFTADDLKNPDKFPLSSFWAVADALTIHPDLEDFLAHGRRFMEKLATQNPQLRDLIKKVSIPSDGNPETSPTQNGGSED